MAAPASRRRKMLGHRRRVEEEGDDEGGLEVMDHLDDDSATDGSLASEEDDHGNDSDTSNVDEVSPGSHNVSKRSGNGKMKGGSRESTAVENVASPAPAVITDTELMLNGLRISDDKAPVQEIDFEDANDSTTRPAAPIVVSSNSAGRLQTGSVPQERRHREHEEYRRKRDEDPAFVPNRGAFFMHDHRHAGPSANGFRPFGRGRGRGRGGFGGPFAPMHQMYGPSDPTTSAPWAHDMHEAVAEPPPHRQARHMRNDFAPHSNATIPTGPSPAEPINRMLSTEKQLGSVQIRVYIPPMKAPVFVSGVVIKQYTKLPDHRPPLRRDKAVRISLPDLNPKFIFPASDRSFIFIPRALRPNQQRLRGGKARSGYGSVGGFSRRTSVFGGSYYGSVYSPSIALSRRSSIALDVGRDFLISPTGSSISRPPLPIDASRPVVRLPPPNGGPPVEPDVLNGLPRPFAPSETSIADLPPPQIHPLPQKPVLPENRPPSVPIYQPRPQKAVSVETINHSAQSNANSIASNIGTSYQQAFHQQVPPQIGNAFAQDAHHRNPSYPSQHSTGTPLSQIPERAIHAAPFQPNTFQQQQGYYGQSYQMMPPQQGYYYPPAFPAATAAAPAFIPAAPQPPQVAEYPQQMQSEPASTPGQNQGQSGLISQEVNGMVYYYDASQLPPMGGFQSYPGSNNFAPGMVGMGGVVNPNPDGYYYPQPNPNMVYYSQ